MKRYILGCLVCLFFLACGSNDKEESIGEQNADSLEVEEMVSLNDSQIKSAGIEVGTPSMQAVSGLLKLQGSIDVPPNSTVSLSFPLGGYLKSTAMLPGTPVRRGQVLAVMEDMQFIQLQQDYLTAKERFRLAEAEFNRQQDLNKSKASSDRVFEQARAAMETQRINRASLEQKLELIGINPQRLDASNISKTVNILSPINGFVSKVNVNVGKYTAPTDMLFELVDPRDIHLSLTVFEKDLPLLSIGQKVWAYTNSDPSDRHEAEIILISRNLDENRSAEVHCHFEQYDHNLYPGMFMNGDVVLRGRTALAVPEDAVVRWENKHYVFLEKEKGTFEMLAVKPGDFSQGFQAVEAEGLDSSSRVVVKNAYALLMKIKNTEEED
ncbi:efflux RND transporter periplasmic adaptor subunit [Olivibacter sitiensis]|uniref:efflux RND transporter periplasmic adaptor subunit n=1 Tax=Olivibacter sitiensis TaxID=376470 RepID=UPI00048563E0|nr:efflux RND transporter periplasmic adaptor subunit [Olivibacter sitiensis]